MGGPEAGGPARACSASRSTAMIVEAPARPGAGHCRASHSPAPEDGHGVARADLAGEHGRARARPSPRSPSSPTASGRAAGSTLVHCPAATSVLSAKAPMPRAGESGVPSASVIFWVALWVVKQYHGRPRRHARHSPQTARQLRTTKSPGATEVTSGPTASTTPAASWPRRKGKSSLIPPRGSADRCGTRRRPGPDGPRPDRGRGRRWSRARRALPGPWRGRP